MSLEVADSCLVLFGIEMNFVLCCCRAVSHAFIRCFVDEVKMFILAFSLLVGVK